MQNAENKRKWRCQLDSSMGYKLASVDQVENGKMSYWQTQRVYEIQGRSMILMWLNKRGTLTEVFQCSV